MATQLVTIKDQVEDAISKVKAIEKTWVKSSFMAYRECGKIILAAGYARTWNNELKQYFLEKTGYSPRTFRYMIQLGKMTEEEFGNGVAEFKSLHGWVSKKKELPNERHLKPVSPSKSLSGKYTVIYADPPWKYNDALDLQGEGAEQHYPLLSLEELESIPVHKLSDKDSILFLWVTMPKLNEGLQLIKAWGFEYKTCAFCWIKTNPKSNTIFKGIGRWVMGNAELCLLATKGTPKRASKSISQVVMANRKSHSQKPEEVRRRIDQLMGNVPKIELFAVNEVKGWDCVGYGINGNDIRKEIK